MELPIGGDMNQVEHAFGGNDFSEFGLVELEWLGSLGEWHGGFTQDSATNQQEG
jgi:hypothetical protein